MFAACFVEIDADRLRRRPFARVGRAATDPLLEIGDRGVGDFAGRRHDERFVLEGRDEQALVDVAGNDGRPAIAAAARTFAGVEQQPAFEFVRLRRVGRVTGVALLDQHGPNLLFEEFEVGGARLRGGRFLSDRFGGMNGNKLDRRRRASRNERKPDRRAANGTAADRGEGKHGVAA